MQKLENELESILWHNIAEKRRRQQREGAPILVKFWFCYNACQKVEKNELFHFS